MTDERDRRSIDELHRRDVEASRAGDFETLRSLIDDDAVVLPPGGAVQRGREALDAAFAGMRRQYLEIEVLEYDQRFEEVTLLGDHAVEWGAIEGAMRRRGQTEVRRQRYHVMRVLRRQGDGSWRVWRTIWNEGPAPPAEV